MELSIVIPTRNQTATVIHSLRSVLTDSACDFELILVDQNDSPIVEKIIAKAGLESDPRLIHLRKPGTGVSRARNLGIRWARAPVIAFTDDDCTATPGWPTAVVARFAADPEMDAWFGSVIAGVEAPAGWIPEFYPAVEGLVTHGGDIIRSMGFTANFAARREVFARIGGFDQFLGPGVQLPNGEDTDLGYRALINGMRVHASNDPHVIHYGLRTGQREIREVTAKYLEGLGAFCMKHARCGDIQLAERAGREILRLFGMGTMNLIHGQRPSGYRGAWHVLLGLIYSWRLGVDRSARLHRPWLRAASVGRSSYEADLVITESEL